MAKGLRYPDEDRQARHDAVDFAGMEAEVREVQAAVERMAPPHAFAHNDLLSGNILVSTLVRLLKSTHTTSAQWHTGSRHKAHGAAACLAVQRPAPWASRCPRWCTCQAMGVPPEHSGVRTRCPATSCCRSGELVSIGHQDTPVLIVTRSALVCLSKPRVLPGRFGHSNVRHSDKQGSVGTCQPVLRACTSRLPLISLECLWHAGGR